MDVVEDLGVGEVRVHREIAGDLPLADPVDQLAAQHGVVAERLLQRLADLLLAEEAELQRVALAAGTNVIDEEIVLGDLVALFGMVPEPAGVGDQQASAIDQGIVDRDDALIAVPRGWVFLEFVQSPFVENLGIPRGVRHEPIETGLIGRLGEFAVDAEHGLTLGDHEPGEVFREMPALAFVGEEVAVPSQGVLHDLGKLDDSRHEQMLRTPFAPGENRRKPPSIFPILTELVARLQNSSSILRCLPRTPAVVLTAFAVLAVNALGGPIPDDTRGSITPYDFATRDDLLFTHLLAPLMKGEPTGWPILDGIGMQLGDWVNQFVSAQQIANVITEAFPIEGQPALRALDLEVEHCARTLGVDTPRVYVRNSPFTRAYVAQAFDQNHLVLTSGLLALYAGRPEELKFVIGHELGHVKCGHLALKQKAFGLLAAVQAINIAVVPDKYQAILPTLGLGRLYTWCRESEISADRAGLLCCGEPKVAYEAIMRLQHGLNSESPWINPEKPDFDPAQVIKSFQQWQYQPFMKLVLDLKRHVLVHPFVPERLAALKAWADTGAYRSILARRPAVTDQLIEVVKIQAFELAALNEKVDPYVLVFDKDTQVLRTRAAAGLRDAEWRGFKSTDKGVDQPRLFSDGQPLFFEIWDDNTPLASTFIGGFVVYPDGHDAVADKAGERVAEYTIKIFWDWKEPHSIARSGFARVTLRFLTRQTGTQGGTPRKAGS